MGGESPLSSERDEEDEEEGGENKKCSIVQRPLTLLQGSHNILYICKAQLLHSLLPDLFFRLHSVGGVVESSKSIIIFSVVQYPEL